MDRCVNDELYDFFFTNAPMFLNDEHLFEMLHSLVLSMLQETLREEKHRVYERLTKVSPC